MLRLLCITAHPDDEASSFGGTLLRSHDRGIETHVLCLTPGQAATHRGGARSDDELAAMRRREFAAACEILKITRGEVLDYPDAALDRVELRSIVGDLVGRIRHLRPHVIITFGPEGAVTAHPDHSMCSIFTSMAYHWAGRSNRYPDQLQNGRTPHCAQKLYYATTLFTLPDRQPVSLAPATADIDIAPHLETKITAFEAHTSQAPLFPLFAKIVRKRGQRELFHLAASVTPQQLQPETDLFAGVVGD
ncbi:MAG: PIG-L deacetylase family protein [Burkholderiales bacterium]